MKTQDRSHWYFTGPFLVFLILLILQGFRMAQGAANGVDQVAKQIDRTVAGDSTWIANGALHIEQLDSAIVVKLHTGKLVVTDTIYGSGGDITRILGTMFSDTARVGGRLRFGWGGYSIYLDSARVDSLWQQIGRFAPGGAGTGDIEGVTAGNGLTGGGITGTVTLNVLVGWGLKIDNDSVKVDMQALLDSVSASADSDFIRIRTDRIAPYTDSGLYFGDTADMTMWWYNLTDTNIIAFVKVYYNEDLPDSALITWHTLQEQIAGMGGDITGVVTNSPIIGGAASGDVNLALDFDWFVSWLDSVTTAKIPVSDSTDGGAARAELAKAVLYSWLYTTIDTSQATVLSVALGNGGTGGGSNGALTLNVVAGTSTGLAVNADSVFISAGGITSTQILDGTVALADHAANSVDSTKIVDGSIGSGDIGTGRITTTHILDGTIALADHASNSVDSTKIVNLSVGNEDLQTGSVNSAKILDASIALGDMASNSVDSTKIVDGGIGSGDIGTGRITTTHILDGTVALADHASNSVDSTKIVDGGIGSGDIGTGRITTTHILDGTIALADHAANSVDSTKIVDGSIGSGDIGTGRITTTHILDATIASGDIATGAIDSIRLGTACVKPAEVDTADSYVVGNLRTGARTTSVIKSNNFQSEDLDSNLKIGSGGQGLTISNSLALGTDITDDSLVTEWNPEFPNMVLYRGGSTLDAAYMDSTLFKIYGGADSTDGNFIIFHDSILTTGNQRRHIAIEMPVPDRVDSLRRVTIQCVSKQYTATSDEFFIVAKLLKAPVTWSSLDSLYIDSTALSGNAHRLLDVDSSASASLTTLHLNPPATANWAVTPFTSRYLVITGRRDAGSVFQWAKVYKIQMVWSRTRL